MILCTLGDRRKWPTLVFKRVTFESRLRKGLISISERRETLYSLKFSNFCVKLIIDDNFGVAVASPSKVRKPSVKIAYAYRLRIDVFEEFPIDYN